MRFRLSVFILLLIFDPANGATAAQAPIVGVATVIDGDTIEIHGTHIRLHGIDAPETAQLCRRPSGKT